MKISKLFPIYIAGAIALMSSLALAAGDVARGEKIAKKCKACHTLNEGGKNKLGPNLFGILGQPVGARKGYKYSRAMSASDFVWDDATFTDFVLNPKKVVTGTKMSFKGIKKAAQREDLLAYFQTLRIEGNVRVGPLGNVEDGMRVAEKHCVVCHSFEKGGKVVYGPNLFGIAGQPAAAVEGYRYSEALKSSGLTWTDTNLIGFLANPERFVEGTTARFPGLKSARQRADILAYMKTLQ
jgi:cytochrome c